MSVIKLDGLTVASSSGSPTVVNLDSDVASRITAKGICKAWVNFDGTNAFSPNPSTTAIRDSFNITCILETGAGWYKANFSTNMSDTNYAVVGSARPDTNTAAYGGHFLLGRYGNNLAVTEVDGVTFTTCKNDQSTYTDSPVICVAIFGS